MGIFLWFTGFVSWLRCFIFIPIGVWLMSKPLLAVSFTFSFFWPPKFKTIRFPWESHLMILKWLETESQDINSTVSEVFFLQVVLFVHVSHLSSETTNQLVISKIQEKNRWSYPSEWGWRGWVYYMRHGCGILWWFWSCFCSADFVAHKADPVCRAPGRSKNERFFKEVIHLDEVNQWELLIRILVANCCVNIFNFIATSHEFSPQMVA